MYNLLLNKKDIIAMNQAIGETGQFNNEASLEFALDVTKIKPNWLYELSYLVRALLVDHAFVDGNKRTTFVVAVYFFEENKRDVDKEKLMRVIHKIAKQNITHPLKIMRLLYHVSKNKN